MFRCSVFNFIVKVIPIKPWQDFLIRRHLGGCRHCREGLITSEEAEILLEMAFPESSRKDFWPAVKHAHHEPVAEKKRFLWPRWRWAMGAAGLAAAVLAVLWIGFFSPSHDIPSPGISDEGFQIKYIKVGDEPADTFVFQTQDSDMIIVWAQKETGGSS